MTIEAEISEQCPLSKAEKRVFGFRAVGLSLSKIAEKIHRAEKTIDTQNSAILAKLGAENINEAVAIAVAEGWLTFKHVIKTTKLMIIVMLIVSTLMGSPRPRMRTFRTTPRTPTTTLRISRS